MENSSPIPENFEVSDVHPLLWFASICCVFFVVVGIPGNLITIIALAKCRKVSYGTVVFIINLQTSDLLFCGLILPLTAFTYWKRHWVLGDAMCQIYPLFKYILNSVSIFSIMAIAINRYVLICHPHMYAKIYSKKNIIIMTLAMWLSAIAIFLPIVFKTWGEYGLDASRFFCTMIEDQRGICPKNTLMLFSILITALVLILCYVRILWMVKIKSNNLKKKVPSIVKLRTSIVHSNSSSGKEICSTDEHITNDNNITEDSTTCNTASRAMSTQHETVTNSFKVKKQSNKLNFSQTEKDRRLYTMIVAIMLSFCVCHMPIMINILINKGYRSNPKANIITHLLEFGANCINPIVYVLISKEYRQSYVNVSNRYFIKSNL